MPKQVSERYSAYFFELNSCYEQDGDIHLARLAKFNPVELLYRTYEDPSLPPTQRRTTVAGYLVFDYPRSIKRLRDQLGVYAVFTPIPQATQDTQLSEYRNAHEDLIAHPVMPRTRSKPQVPKNISSKRVLAYLAATHSTAASMDYLRSFDRLLYNSLVSYIASKPVDN